jgi:two-component system chemotaxis response regulator CheV
MHVPEVTVAPDMPPGVKGMVSLRGTMIPVVDLAHFCEFEIEEEPKILIVTEYNRTTQGFLVHSVEHIRRMEWSDIKVPPAMMAHKHGGLVTAVSELEDSRIVMMIDVEKVMAETVNAEDEDLKFEGLEETKEKITVFYADDSSVARKQIEKTLDKLGVNHIGARNGDEAWQRLDDLAVQAEASNTPMHQVLSAILTDIEMPGMDGFVLTKKIKNDARFNGIPVVMHSSLSADANINIGKSVGADAYVAKFHPRELSSTIMKVLNLEE